MVYSSVIISQFYGARNKNFTSRAVHTSMALALVGGAIMTVLGIGLSPVILRAMGTPADILDFSITYLRIYFAGVVFNLIYNVGSGLLRAIGDSRRPLYFLIICSIINVVLDIVFVLVIPMGVAGVALATIISQAISAALVIVSLQKAPPIYRLELKKIGFDFDILRQIIYIGLPAGLQSVMYSLSNIIIQASVNSFGTNTVAAWTAYGKIDGLFWMTISSFGIAITTFVGQNFGAKEYGRVKKSVRICLWIALGFTIALSGFLLLLGPRLYRLFTTDAAVISLGVDMLKWMVPFYFTYIAIEILSGALRGAGDAILPMIITCLGVCVLRVVWIMVVVPMYPDIRTTCMSYPVTWSITSILFIVYYLQGSWLKRSIVKADRIETLAAQENSIAKI